jgi:hypothetical protein
MMFDSGQCRSSVLRFFKRKRARLNGNLSFQLVVLTGVLAFIVPGFAQDVDRRQLIERDQQNLARPYGIYRDLNEPRPFTTMESLLPQLHSIIEANVASIDYDYLDCQGPRTVVRLENIKTLLGGRTESTLTLRTFGGYLPNGHYVYASEMPHYVLGAHYILFLRNNDWKFSPVIGDLAFRTETIAGKTVLLDSDGAAVSGVSEVGILRETPQLTEAVGQRVKGTVATRDIMPREKEGEATSCEAGKSCEAPNKENAERRSTDLTETGRFARPGVIANVTAADVSAAISTSEMVDRIKRFAEAYNVRFDGNLQTEPRMGCWNVTPTQRPQ